MPEDMEGGIQAESETAPMTKLDLRPFGFECEVDVYGIVADSWNGGNRVLFLFGENRDRTMKKLNVLNACAAG
jgi:hypothetical protein